MTALLSICIATLASREDKFNALRTELLKQCCDLGFRTAEQQEGSWWIGSGATGIEFALVEILWDRDEGVKPVGAKRHDMLERATGQYVTSIDDDDEISGDYISSIVAALDGLEVMPDCIGFDIDCYGYADDPTTLETARVSRRYIGWKENVDGFRYVRCPHHLVPIRRELALKSGFPRDKRSGEDADYSLKLLGLQLLKNEVFIPRVLYIIHHERNKGPGQ